MTERNRKTVIRWVLYILGVLMLALGLSLSRRTNLGIAPLTSIAEVTSIISGWSFGNTTLVSYIVFMLLQMLLRGRKYPLKDLLQLPFSIVFSRLLDAICGVIPVQTKLPGQITFLILGMIATGIGAAMTLNMRLIPNPADGLVQALSDVTGKEMGLCKNGLDIFTVTLTAILGLLFHVNFIGNVIGIGTLCAMIIIGRVMAVFNHFAKEPMLKAAGM